MSQNPSDSSRPDMTGLIFVLSLLIGSFLLTNAFFLRAFENFVEPNDRLSLIGAAILLTIFVIPNYSRRLFRLMRTRYGIMIVLFFVLIHFSTFVFGGLIDQRQAPLRSALVVTRIYAGLLAFFWLGLFCRRNSLFLLLNRFVLVTGGILIAFFLFAYFAPDLASTVYKTPLKDFQVRLDTIRFTPPAGARIAMMYTAFYSLARLLSWRRFVDLAWFIPYGAGVFVFLYACMLRRHSAALLLVPAVWILFAAQLQKKVKFAVVAVLIAGGFFVVSPPQARQDLHERVTWIYDSVIDELNASEATSANIRVEAFEYYLPELKRCWYLGYGYYAPNFTARSSRLAGGQIQGYYEGDLGIAMPLLMYGVQAILWTAAMYTMLLRDLSSVKGADPHWEAIRLGLLCTVLWSLLTLHNFVWGYAEPFWWSVIIFMVYYLRKQYSTAKASDTTYPSQALSPPSAIHQTPNVIADSSEERSPS